MERKQPAIKSEPIAAGPYANLSNPATLEKLNNHLESNSYIEGFIPSCQDLVVHLSVPQQVLASYLHIKRWYHHIDVIKDTVQV